MHEDDDNNDYDPETLPDEIREGLAEIFNIAAGVADLQVEAASAENIYLLMGALSDYFGISISYIPDDFGDFETAPVETRFVDASTTAPQTTTSSIQVNDKDGPMPDRDFGDSTDSV
tara:strand:+ start:2419 stop:2769 length:351 start_codon:yes stop_codon:yes gene_type:complete